MDTIFFKKEIDCFLNETIDAFRTYQQLAWSILKELNRLSIEYNIDYYLAYGTLLGAVRDRGPIPWDYDIDTFVKIDDRERLIQILDSYLGSDFYYDYINLNKEYPAPCLRICKKGYAMTAIHVDVFFLIGLPEKEIPKYKFINKAKKYVRIRTNKYISLYMDLHNSSRVVNLLVRIRERILNFLPSSYLIAKEEKLLHKYNLRDSDFWFSYGESKFFPRNCFREIAKIDIDGTLYPIPIEFEKILDICYGDWENYQPIKQRFEEVYNSKFNIEERQIFMNKKKIVR